MYAYPNATPTDLRTEGGLYTHDVSPYELIKILNEKHDLELPTQMGYNYTKKGMVDGIKRTSCKGVKINKDKANEWAEKYLGKNNK
jgi:hypothetical protein